LKYFLLFGRAKIPKKSLKKVRGGEGGKKRLAGKTQDFENPVRPQTGFLIGLAWYSAQDFTL